MRAQKIEGTVALVTGANRGIGRALTEALLARGVKKVYAAARHPELAALRDERVVPLRLDVTGLGAADGGDGRGDALGRCRVSDDRRWSDQHGNQ